jgi:F-type H+-transporting ATPase subunit b
MLEIDKTLFIQIANFLVLLFFLNILLFKPIRGILAKRSEEQNSLQKSIEEYQTRSDQSEKGIEEGKIRARKEGATEKEGLKGQGQEKERGILHKASTAAEEKKVNARKDMEAKISDVRRSLEDQVAVFSHELAEKILGRSLQ